MTTVEEIINGVFYSTNTATLIAEKETENIFDTAMFLYKTPKDNYFKVVKFWGLGGANMFDLTRFYDLEPISKKEAMIFYENNRKSVPYQSAFGVQVEI